MTTKDLLELKIINGTHWLHLGGNVETFEAVIGEPPATSSEVTLVQALEEINKVRHRSIFFTLFFEMISALFSDFNREKKGYD